MHRWSSDYIAALPNTAFAYVAADGSRHLPYRSAEGRVSLPAVRDALAGLSDLQMSESDRTTVKDKLQGSLKADDSDDEMMSFTTAIQAGSNGTDLPQRMMLLRSGVFNTQKYGEVPMSAADIHQMHDNFKAGIGMAGDGSTGIPVDFSHESGKKAAAWIKDMEVVDKDSGQAELWATETEWSRAGREAIVGKEFKCLSSDFYPSAFGEWADSESGVRAKNVIVGAALTNRPMFTGNQPVVASETSQGGRQITKYVIASEVKEQSMDINAIRVKAADDVSVQEQRFLQAHAADLSAEERKKFEIVEVKAATTNNDDGTKPKVVQASSVKGDEGLVAVQAAELKGLTDQIGALQASESERVKASMAAEVDKHIKRGAIKADRKDSWIGRLVAADEAGRKEIVADLEALAENPTLKAEQGKGDADADTNGGESARNQLMAHATDIMKKSSTEGKPIDIKAAYDLAKEQHPELVEASTAEHQARLTASDDQYAKAGINRG